MIHIPLQRPVAEVNVPVDLWHFPHDKLDKGDSLSEIIDYHYL